MRADNKGEGGSLALLALISRKIGGQARWTAGIVLLGVFATALFYGDSMITPAISVLSAVEGLTTVAGRVRALRRADRGRHPGRAVRDPVARHGAGRRVVRPDHAALFHDHLGARRDAHRRSIPAIILATLNPLNALNFFHADGLRAFLALGSVVLAVTGAEALYADMGHFGRKPIGVSWLCLRHAGADAQLYGAGRDDAVAEIRTAAPSRSRTRSSCSRPRAAPAARHPRDHARRSSPARR